MADDRGLARFLGWFSIGLGLAQVATPRRFAQMVGATGDDDSSALARWDAEIVDDRPGEMIAWRSVEHADAPTPRSRRTRR